MSKIRLKDKRVFVTSDHHFGQKSAYSFNEKYGRTLRPEFSNCEEADAEIVRRHNSIVPENDSIVFFLGDVAFNSKSLDRYLPQMNGESKYLVMGNHDVKFSNDKLRQHFKQLFGVYVIYDKRNIVLTHIPIHEHELFKGINIHGHLHTEIIKRPGYFSACLEVNNYYPTEITIMKV